MINIDILTIGNELKNDNGDTYKVTSNFNNEDKLLIELTKVVNEPELIKET